MPIFQLSDKASFPPPHFSEGDGLLAVGGDLSQERLLKAYYMVIFPWYSDPDPILWWSPDPRLVLFPSELKVSRRLRRTIRCGTFRITMDTAFEQVIKSCAKIPRKHEKGTWITPDMVAAYCRLHTAGFAHSVEVWSEGRLAGGLYGVAIGRCFFGESMFSNQSNASKVAFVELVEYLHKKKFRLIDCQVTTPHLKNFGAREIPRAKFLNILED
ncbi:MAG: leucyl/phenylalanyl-tRNA--protein transferase, partial [Bacteroidetes bacterium]